MSSSWQDAKEQVFLRREEKLFRKARRRNRTATHAYLEVIGQRAFEDFMAHGWELVEAHTQQTLYDWAPKYKLRKALPALTAA